LKPRVLVYHSYLLPDYMKILTRERPDVAYFACSKKEDIERNIGEVDVIFGPTNFPGDLLAKAENLKWVQVMGAGVERFVFAGSIPSGVTLTRIRGTFGPRMAEYVIAHMLMITQKARMAWKQQQEHVWETYVPDVLYEKTFGVFGLGTIGSEVARKAAALGMTVIGLDQDARELPFLTKSYSMDRAQEFAASADFIALCLPLTPGTRGIVDAKFLSWMKSSSHLINVCRGAVIVTDDLVSAVRSGVIAGAVIDVVESEPLPVDSPLWDLPNSTVTPHMSGFSEPTEVTTTFLKNLKLYEAGLPLTEVVDLKKGY
jgi:phosphoglycerate dehydrogenase-like enzyme